jgi:hypothetical protein
VEGDAALAQIAAGGGRRPFNQVGVISGCIDVRDASFIVDVDIRSIHSMRMDDSARAFVEWRVAEFRKH